MKTDNGYDNTNSGALFVNERRQNEKQPQYTGTLNVEGVEYWLSAWLKKSRDGRGFMSLALTKKETKPTTLDPPINFGEDEDIPF